MLRRCRIRTLGGLICAATVVLLLSWVPGAYALYVWTDEQGVTHITEYPDPRKADTVTEQLKYKGPERQTPPPTPPQEEEIRKPLPPRPELRFARPGDAEPRGDGAGGRARDMPADAQKQIEEALSRIPLTAEEQRELQEAFKQVPSAQPEFNLEDERAAAGVLALIMAFLGGFLLIFAFVGIGIYVFFSLCLFFIAKKLDVPNPWIAWIPLAQSWTFVQCAGKPWWWLLLLWLGLIIFAPVGMIVGVILWVSITENLGQNKWLGLLTLLPLVNLFFVGYLAFSKSVAAGGHGGSFNDASGEFGGDMPPEEPAHPDLPAEGDYEDSEPPPLPR